MKVYLEKIKASQTLDELNDIIETAAFDESLTNAQYCQIYSEAVRKERD